MKDREFLKMQIEHYVAHDQKEEQMRLSFLDLIDDHDCFKRSRLSGHITASAWVINKENKSVLMLHHKKLDKWLQPGGHCDGDENTLRVALKEVKEETGLVSLKYEEKIFDLDIHSIPQRKQIPQHLHYDVRYIFQALAAEELVKNDESNELKWVNYKKLKAYTSEASILRMLSKTDTL